MSVSSRILVVEDDADIREAMTDCLAFDGYEVEAAADGALALAALRALPFDAVVLDLMMPVVTGRDVVAAMRADPRLASIPVVVCTARRDADASALGAACLYKPFDVSDLLSVLRRVTGAGAGDGG